MAIQLIPLASPLLLGRDPLVYIAWGKMSQPFVKHGSWPPIEPYGPLWALISEPISRLNGGVFTFRVLAAVAILASSPWSGGSPSGRRWQLHSSAGIPSWRSTTQVAGTTTR